MASASACLVDQAAAGGVDDDHAGLGLGQRLLADQARGLLGLRQVHRDEVGAAQQLVERQQFDAELGGARRRHVRVVGDDVGAERGQPLGHQLADAAEADHADGLAEDLGAGERRPLPGVLAQRRVGGGDLPGRGQQQRQRMLGGAVDVRRRRVDHQHAARGGGVDVDVVQADAGAGDDLQLGRGGQHLGVDGGGRAHQQRVGFRHRGQQLLSVGAVDPADFYLVAQGGDGRFGQFVGDQYNRQTHADSLMGCIDMVGGRSQRGRHRRRQRAQRPGGRRHLRQGRSVGAGRRGPADARAAVPAPCADPEFPGVATTSARRCTRWRWRRRSSPSSTCAARGVHAGGAGDLLRQSAARPARRDRLPRPRPHLRRTRRRRVVASSAGPARRTRRRRRAQTAARRQAFDSRRSDRRASESGLRLLAQGTPGVGRACAASDARALFTGVAAHTISQMPSLVSAGAGLMLATLAHAVGWPIPVGGTPGHPRRADRRPAGPRRRTGARRGGHRSRPAGVVLYDTAPTALLRIYGDALPSRYAKALRRYRFGPGVAKVDFVLSGEIPWRDPRLAQAPTLHMGGTREQMALAEREVAAGRHAEWPMVLAALPHLADPAPHRRAGPPAAVDVRPRAVGLDRRPDRDRHRGLRALRARLPRRRGGGARACPPRGWPTTTPTSSAATSASAATTCSARSPARRCGSTRGPRRFPKAYLCSSATPPGGGVHGMAGYYAARTVLRREFGITQAA